MKIPSVAELKGYALARSLVTYPTLADALHGMGFVQADPIRAPARAQDLILRQRVEGYRAGDLDAAYASLEVEEDLVHVYGFLAREHAPLLHPRKLSAYRQRIHDEHRALKPRILAFLRKHGEAHPAALESAFAPKSITNAWGGSSNATTAMLEVIHRTGKIRVARRDGGVRVFALSEPRGERMSAAARGDGIARLIASLYAPMPERSLRETLNRLSTTAGGDAHPKLGVARLVARGELRREVIDGPRREAWIWPAAETVEGADDDRARLLAPFDPVVWDRRRFNAFFGWDYRFEAYTPVAKRKLGYYALPLLWQRAIVGWGNVASDGKALQVSIGYVGKKPRERRFNAALDEEIDRMRAFLSL